MDWDALTQKKLRLDKHRPLAAAVQANLRDWFRVELTYTSNAIEGNTLTRQETALVVQQGLTVGGKALREHLEATNHARALDWITVFAQSTRPIGEREILALHEMILQGIDADNAGRYRNAPVRIAGSTTVLPNPRKVPDLMAQFAEWLLTARGQHPAEQAAEAHFRLVTIHPFIDGNGRTARLLMNLLLLRHGYPPAIVRIEDRLAYLNSLERAQTGGSKDAYFEITSAAVDRSLDIYLEAAGEAVRVAPTSVALLKIGDLALETDVPIATLRHWLSLGLLRVAARTPSGYQLFAPDAVQRVQQIRDLKKQRYRLEDIAKLPK